MAENPVKGFGLSYNEELIYCEVVMHENHYEVLFNGNWIAAIEMNGHGRWMQASGIILPQSIIHEIGEKIGHFYG
ncbi:hypothetical protein [Mucilaginibacter sp. BT774]|uniref:hypothetical protein n=1 Tax=Mucilaginibacter sp. BT774 TaxID=3062276 RepID=UPI002674A6CD|nr:hypothetical protein [Mucilaginibacter sp. BT774]MDO3627537.1 hypothetical protein [Mucilaginibacter sp. BT774]